MRGYGRQKVRVEHVQRGVSELEKSAEEEAEGLDVDSETEKNALRHIFYQVFSRAKRRLGYHPIPFGPYIALAAMIVLIWHYEIETFLVGLFSRY
jgi:hypothetical protein